MQAISKEVLAGGIQKKPFEERNQSHFTLITLSIPSPRLPEKIKLGGERRGCPTFVHYALACDPEGKARLPGWDSNQLQPSACLRRGGEAKGNNGRTGSPSLLDVRLTAG